MSRIPLFCLSFAVFLTAAEKKLPIEETSNEVVDITASIILDRDEIKKELGSDFNGDLMLVRVKVRPVNDKPLLLDLDDFYLISGKDGQRSEPYAPSQLAGDTTIMITPQGTRKGGMLGRNNGPAWGGGGGRPSQLPGNGGGVGNGATIASGDVKVEEVKDDKPNPLLATLKEKGLPEKSITDPVEGLLYFPSVGAKLKPKDLELHYKGPAGRLGLRFRP
jgi:hypothetical protein